MKKAFLVFSFLLVLFLSVSVHADLYGEGWIESFFDVVVGPTGEVESGGGGGGGATGPEPGGYYSPEWYYYPQTDWWNVWFYDHPFDSTRWKEVDIFATLVATGPGATATVAINWSTDLYAPGEFVPPLPPLDEPLIERMILCENINLEACGGSYVIDCGPFELPVPYNPEWISIDIRGTNFEITDGVLLHACVPEPATMVLLGLGGLALIRKRS